MSKYYAVCKWFEAEAQNSLYIGKIIIIIIIQPLNLTVNAQSQDGYLLLQEKENRLSLTQFSACEKIKSPV